MKNIYKALWVCAALMIAVPALSQLKLPPSGANQKSMTRQYMGPLAWVEIVYNSPDVAGRDGQIWGKLIPYGVNNLGFGKSTADNPSPWRAGANENTTIEFSHDMTLQGQPVKAGKYGLHVITQEKGDWTILLTSEHNAWGSYFYTPDQEVMRVSATPAECDHHEFLAYVFTQKLADKTEVELRWEKKKLPFSIEVPKNNEYILASLKSQLSGQSGFQWTNLINAANWASGAGYHDQALVWADQAISAPFVGQRNYQTLQVKANVLANKGDQDAADMLMGEAIKEPSATAFQIHSLGRQLIGKGKKEKALEVMLHNHKRFAGAWPTSYGLGRAYSANGDYKKAIKHLQVALKNVPAGDTVNPPLIKENIEKLKKGQDIN